MSLIKCPECGKDISTKADSCPNCGHPMKVGTLEKIRPKKMSKKAFRNIVIVLTGAIIFVAAFFSAKAQIIDHKIEKAVEEFGTGYQDSEPSQESNSNKHETVTHVPTKEPVKETELPVSYVSESELAQVYTNPDKYKNKWIKVSGKVFGEIEEEDGVIYFQMIHDPSNMDGNTAVAVESSGLEIKSDDYVIVDGMIAGSIGGENAFGGSVNTLGIYAKSVEKSDYINVMSPTIKNVPLDLSINQSGYIVTIEKIEFAKEETRVYVKINNNGTSTFSFYDFNMKIVQNGKQYEPQTNYDADYQEIQSEILQGVESTGIVTFPPIDQNSNLQIFCEGHSDNWDEEIQTYQYDIYVN